MNKKVYSVCAVFMCVCVRERERERKKEKEKERRDEMIDSHRVERRSLRYTHLHFDADGDGGDVEDTFYPPPNPVMNSVEDSFEDSLGDSVASGFIAR